MRLFKLFASEQANARELQTTITPGPFLVAAQDPRWARMLVGMNYSIAVSRNPGEMIPNFVWSDGGPSECVHIPEVEPASVQQSRMIGSTDIAVGYLHRLGLVVEGKPVAKMVWWPCSPRDLCPV